MPAAAVIEAQGITVIRQGNTLLQEVSLSIAAGDFVSLIGPNGAGKTTLLKILLGVMQPDQGTVNRQADLRIGYMPQALIIEPLLPLTVRRFLRLACPASRMEIETLAGEVGITPVLDRQLGNLSGGERQRVLLARALIRRPQVLMLDEPVQNLDIHGQLHFYELLEKLYQVRGLTILMVSHDLHMVMRATRKVVCLYHHICCEGAPATITQHPRFIELFGQDMSRMLKVYQHSHDHNHQEGGSC